MDSIFVIAGLCVLIVGLWAFFPDAKVFENGQLISIEPKNATNQTNASFSQFERGMPKQFTDEYQLEEYQKALKGESG
jgi:hypothetical protein